MEDFEISKANTSEDAKLKLLDGDLKRKEWTQEKEQLSTKIKMLENAKKVAQDDLKATKVKEQELLDQVKKLQAEKEESAKEKRVAEDRMRAEIKQREKLQIENHNLMRQLNSLNSNQAGQMTYEQLNAKCKELENDNIILKCQMKPVVVYNREAGTFEYISQPIPLINEEGNQAGEIADVEEFLVCLRRWLNRAENQSLTVRTIFEQMDL